MCFLIKYTFIILLTTIVITQAEEIHESLIDYYSEIINNRTKAANSYVLPTDARMHEPQNKTVEDYGEFDFIVIGAGSTGSIIASRLSEVRKWSVLLLEAGTYPDEDLTRIPALYLLDAESKFNWNYNSVPQKNACFDSADNRCNVRRGKGIGGTSLINSMIYVRGNKLDYDKWSHLLNDSSYKYENLLPLFRKTENFTRTNPNTTINWEYHGTTGPLHMTQSIITSELQTAFLQGSKQLGYNFTDYNGRQQVSANIVQSYLKNGKRDDPGLAFISKAQNRRNFRVSDQSFVVKLDIDNNTKRINGVIFTRNNKTYLAKNRKEVVLSAGVFGSPQILMLSGVGPKDHLNSLGIPVIQNLPVGKTLRDHGVTTLTLTANASTLNTEEAIREYVEGRGPLTSPFYFNSIGFFKVPKGLPENNPDVEVVLSKRFGTYDNQGTFLLGYIMLHPQAKGSFKLKSDDPYEYPLIDPNILGDDRDMDIMYETFKVVSQLLETQPLRKFNLSLTLTGADECNQTQPLSKDFWFCYLKRATSPGSHTISTCLMGTNPETGVVDKNFKVFGMKDLRVADTSVIPFPLANHPTATCAVLAEKISDEIKRQYKYSEYN